MAIRTWLLNREAAPVFLIADSIGDTLPTSWSNHIGCRVKRMFYMNNLYPRPSADIKPPVRAAQELFNEPVGRSNVYLAVKRGLDVAFSLMGLLVLSPAMAVIAFIVRFDSSGPALYCQSRVGKDGLSFILYKFRTMRTDAPELPTDEMKRISVSYYTKWGRILRRFSLDELPQLWNVLCGQMSIIGPRPSLQSQSWLNSERRQRGVYDLRPGITGLAQVSGRDELSDEEKLKFDAIYRRSISLWLDLRIAFLTIKAVFSGAGAN